MPFKISYIFKSDEAGFSENWYAADVSDTTGTNAKAVMARAVAVGAARAGLLGAYCYLEDIRVADLAYKGASLSTSQVAGPPGTSTFKVPDPDPDLNALATLQANDQGILEYKYERDTNWNSIDCRAVSTNLYKRQVYLRGVPDLWIAYDQFDDPIFSDPVFNTKWLLFVKAVIANAFCIQSISKDSTVNPRSAIAVGGLTKGAEYPVGSGIYNWQITAPAVNMNTPPGAVPVLTNGMRVRIGGVKGVNLIGVDGYHTIYNVTAGPPQTFQIFVPYPLNPPAPFYLGTGWWKPVNLSYPAVDNILVRKYGSRKVGRRFFKQPGKLPAKKKF